LEADDDPVRIISWLQSSISARLLAELAAAGKRVTHDLLDTLPAGRDECYVRALLAHTAVLEPREEGLERIPPWLERILVDRPPAHARLVHPCTYWVLLRAKRAIGYPKGAPRPGVGAASTAMSPSSCRSWTGSMNNSSTWPPSHRTASIAGSPLDPGAGAASARS